MLSETTSKKKKKSVCARAHMHMLHCVWLFAAPWTVAHQDPLSLEFSRQEYCSGLVISFYRGSSQPRDQTPVSWASCINRWILYYWTTREALNSLVTSALIIVSLIAGSSRFELTRILLSSQQVTVLGMTFPL